MMFAVLNRNGVSGVAAALFVTVVGRRIRFDCLER